MVEGGGEVALTRSLEPLPLNAASVWNDALTALREDCPTSYPVKVIRRKLEDCWGWCEFNEARQEFLIVIHPTTSPNFSLELLIHEWAHAMDWFSVGEADTDHGATWGVCYAKAYTAVMWR